MLRNLETFESAKNIKLFNSYVQDLPYHILEDLFEFALEKKIYVVAFYLFCHATNLADPHEYSYRETNDRIKHFNDLMAEVFKLINKPVNNSLLLKLIHHGITEKVYIDSFDKAYFLICTKSTFIKDFEQVDAKYNLCYKLVHYKTLFTALDYENAIVIEYLLKSKHIDLKNNKIISYTDCSHMAVCNFHYHADNDITFTPLQGVLLLATKNKFYRLEFLLDIIKKFIAYDRGCLGLDSMGNSVVYYFNKLRRSKPGMEHEKILNQIAELLGNEICLNNILAFICASNPSSLSIIYYLPKDIIYLISALMWKQSSLILKTYSFYNASIRVNSSFGDSIINDINSLDKDELVEIFECALSENQLGLAARLFCSSNQITINYSTFNMHASICYMLAEFCKQIVKPVNAVCILKLFEHMHHRGKYVSTNSNSNYANLCNKKDLISDWEVVERNFIYYFKPDLSKTIDIALKENCAAAVVYLLEKIQQKMNSDEHHKESLYNQSITLFSVPSSSNSIDMCSRNVASPNNS